MQNPIFRFRQSSITSQKPGCFSEKMKNLMSSDYHKVQYFLPKFCTRFLLDNVYKSAFEFFFILFRSCVIDKNQVFWIFANNLRSKKIEKNLQHSFIDIGKQETCAKFQQKIWNSMVYGARQKFQFFRQKVWFRENNKSLRCAKRSRTCL